MLFHFPIHLMRFNPRICKRCDKGEETDHEPGDVSIHASVKDATGGGGGGSVVWNVSIHASVKDATFQGL